MRWRFGFRCQLSGELIDIHLCVCVREDMVAKHLQHPHRDTQSDCNDGNRDSAARRLQTELEKPSPEMFNAKSSMYANRGRSLTLKCLFCHLIVHVMGVVIGWRLGACCSTHHSPTPRSIYAFAANSRARPLAVKSMQRCAVRCGDSVTQQSHTHQQQQQRCNMYYVLLCLLALMNNQIVYYARWEEGQQATKTMFWCRLVFVLLFPFILSVFVFDFFFCYVFVEPNSERWWPFRISAYLCHESKSVFSLRRSFEFKLDEICFVSVDWVWFLVCFGHSFFFLPTVRYVPMYSLYESHSSIWHPSIGCYLTFLAMSSIIVTIDHLFISIFCCQTESIDGWDRTIITRKK